jgi:regulator of protease activity HflC (stomatin/prohibitin superfamily)
MEKWCVLVMGLSLTACGATIEPGHRGLLFNPRDGGLQNKVLEPGRHYTGFFGRIDDFDVTYSTRKEEMNTVSQEGLHLTIAVSAIFRPVVSELYALDTEIGPAYYEEVIGPEFRSATRGVFARHSYTDIAKQNEAIENEIETDLRRRIAGKHLEITSVTLEGVSYAPEIAKAVQDKLVGEQDTARQKVILDNEALRRKLELEHEAEREKLKAESELREAARRTEIAKAQAELDRVRAATEAEIKVTRATADAKEMTLLAAAKAAAKKAEAEALTPLAVMVRAYEALGQLGQNGATVYLGDFSHVPAFLFPKVAGLSPTLDVSKGVAPIPPKK